MEECVLEYREYDEWVQCAVCLWSCTTCVFYSCLCKHCQFKLCPNCCCSVDSSLIKKCEFCSVNNDEVIDFCSFYKENEKKSKTD